jgi:hypothetical protein
VDAKEFVQEACTILKTYKTGLPPFLNEPITEARYSTLMDFLLNAKSETDLDRAILADELEVQLRDFAIKLRKAEATSLECIACVHEVGKRLYALMQALGYDSDAQWREANAWAFAINKVSGNSLRIFTIHVGEPFSAEQMHGGTANSPVRAVRSWGVKNARNLVQERALVS